MKSAEELAESIRSKLVGGGKGLTRKRVAAVAKVIKAAQEKARREALEAALRLAESHPEDCNHKRKPFCCDEYAKQLRTLIDKEPNEAP